MGIENLESRFPNSHLWEPGFEDFGNVSVFLSEWKQRDSTKSPTPPGYQGSQLFTQDKSDRRFVAPCALSSHHTLHKALPGSHSLPAAARAALPTLPSHWTCALNSKCGKNQCNEETRQHICAINPYLSRALSLLRCWKKEGSQMSWLSWQTCLQDFPGSAIFTWRALNGGHITCPWQKSCSDRSCFVMMCSDNISQYSDCILTLGNSPKGDQIIWAWSIMVCFLQTNPKLVGTDPSLWPKAPIFIYQFSISAWAFSFHFPLHSFHDSLCWRRKFSYFQVSPQM